ncbi:ankyrin repeat protein [Medicago truncatula]|uniref:Ankyrin repeat protein n=2 Tax=Medicago truncatula TaxID=3880 RepID=G7K9M3_MEDTR|nr:ankyrin repeat protein [Medicago truncatula]
MNNDETSMFSMSSSGRTILHVAVIAGHEEIVKNLVKEGKDKLVKMKDNRGYTALALVSELTGNTNIAKCLVEMKGGQVIRKDLLYMKNNDGEIPVLLAAAKGHKDMTSYLFAKTYTSEDMDDKKFHSRVLLLTRCINAEIFDVALSLLQRFQQLPLAHKSESETESDGVQPLYALARMPHVFPSGSRYGFIRRFIYKIIKEIYDQKMTHSLVLEILNCLYKKIQEFKESELREASAYDAMLQAAKHGNIEFIDAMRKANPDLLWAIDKNKRGIFSHAILNRRKEVFQLIHDASVNGRKEIVRCRVDEFDNTLLHLAGNLGPSFDLHRRSGPALQMQREILWFKEVEKIVHPKCKEAKNSEDKKPHEIFTESHKELVKAGEKWAKETAGSFTLVATLITTIMFAAAFTVPGGNNQDSGIPLFLHDYTFNVFIIADAISLFTSSTSVLLFIGILTARYAEKDFLKSLPLKLLFGLVMLFFSVVSMMVAFCASLAMLLKGHQGVIITAISFASIPVIVLVPSQLRLFIEIFKSTVLFK